MPEQTQLSDFANMSGRFPMPYSEILANHSKVKIGELTISIFQQLLSDGRIGLYIKRLQDKDYSHTNLRVNFPVLTRSRKDTIRRYYAPPFVFEGHEYYLCNHLFKAHRTPLLTWLTETVLKNPTAA